MDTIGLTFMTTPFTRWRGDGRARRQSSQAAGPLCMGPWSHAGAGSHIRGLHRAAIRRARVVGTAAEAGTAREVEAGVAVVGAPFAADARRAARDLSPDRGARPAPPDRPPTGHPASPSRVPGGPSWPSGSWMRGKHDAE